MRTPGRVRSDQLDKSAGSSLDPWGVDLHGGNSAEDVLGEIGLVLLIVLGIVFAINMLLVAFHVG
ncbi:MAG TPA: hypothetical protein VHY79_08310 [Rhizomicrobium sp.]|jgi:hypothetical protein|nr:hypothetical protein [Rhizomicrobium sp.]